MHRDGRRELERDPHGDGLLHVLGWRLLGIADHLHLHDDRDKSVSGRSPARALGAEAVAGDLPADGLG